MENAFLQPPESSRNEAIVTEWIESMRPALKSYVISLLPQSDSCDDIVQETCLFLWEKRNDFTPDSNFKAWAFKAAWFKALSHRRDLQRRNIVTFSEDILQRIAGTAHPKIPAKITGLVGVEWNDGAAPDLLGDASASDRVLIKTGLVELTYASGVRLTLEGPADFQVSDATSGRLNAGKIYATVPKGAEGFHVDYAQGRVVDLGTEFAMEVRNDGITESHILRDDRTLIFVSQPYENAVREGN